MNESNPSITEMAKQNQPLSSANLSIMEIAQLNHTIPTQPNDL